MTFYIQISHDETVVWLGIPIAPTVEIMLIMFLYHVPDILFLMNMTIPNVSNLKSMEIHACGLLRK